MTEVDPANGNDETMGARERAFQHQIADFAARPAVLWVGVVAMLLALFLQRLDADPDLFARVAVGRLVAATGEVPARDPFAFTTTKALWVDHEWLSGVVFHRLSVLGGDAALFWFKVVMAAVSALVLLLARRAFAATGSIAPVAFVYVMLLSSYVFTSTVRAQVFTYVLLPLFLLAIGRHRRSRSWLPLATLPVMTAAWAQLHGGFVVGLGLLLLYLIDVALARRREALAVLVAWSLSVAAVLLHPAGFEYLRYLGGALTLSRATIPEWQPLSPMQPTGIALLVLVLLAAIGLRSAWRAERRNDAPPRFALLFLLVSLYFAWRHERLVAVFAMTLYAAGGAAIAPRWFCLDRRPALSRAVRGGLGFGLIAATLLALAWSGRQLAGGPVRLSYRDYPLAAAEWLYANRKGGHVLCGFNQGSFLLWRLHPQFLVAVDGRYEEVYPEATVAQAALAIDPTRAGHASALAAVAPDYILVKTSVDYAEVPAARRFAGTWQRIFQDDRYLLLQRGDAGRDPAVPRAFDVSDVDIWTPRF